MPDRAGHRHRHWHRHRHRDEACARAGGRAVYLWRAVAEHGRVRDALR